ncbi:hypothetical protein JTF08_13790 [Micrococcaceae bacterium RIT802]|nr:hypothetical protein [Micrococcaceae bacterium RIT 802]
MATAPARAYAATPTVGWASTANNKTTPVFDVQAGDLIVLVAFSEDAQYTLPAPTWTGAGAWTLRQSVVVSGYCTAYLYTCVVTATATGRTISMSRSGGQWSFYASGWRNHGGLGVSGKANVNSGAPALNLATAPNSAVIVGNSDWTANGSAHSWRTVNGTPIAETSRGGTAGTTYMCYSGYSPDTGPAGTITFGMLTPSTQKYSIVGVEILGTADTAPSFEWDAVFEPDVVLTSTLTPAFAWDATLDPDAALSAGVVPAFAWGTTREVGVGLSGSGTPGFAWDATAAPDVELTGSTAPHFAWDSVADVDVSLSGAQSSDRAWSATFGVDVELTGAHELGFEYQTNLDAGVDLMADLSPAFAWDAVFTPDVGLTGTISRGRSWYSISSVDVDLTGTIAPHFAWDATFDVDVALSDQPQEPNMAQPSPDWNLVLLKWAGVRLDGTPCTGQLKFTYNGAGKFMLDDDPETPLSIYTAELSVQLVTKMVLFEGVPREVGYAEIWVPASNDPDITGAGGTYTCTEKLDGSVGQAPFQFVADIDAPDGVIWLNKVEHVA